MIIGKNICKTFEDLIIFKNLNFTINDGEFICFSGASGTGKTTLLNIIGLLEPFDSGELIINGKSYMSNREKREFYRNEVGFLFQNFALIENKTVRQNLEIVKQNRYNTMSIEEALARVGLSEKIDSKVYTLSGGEQQRVALARLILKQCNIVLADEPTGSLDEKNADIVMSLLKALNNEGKTVIIVTHDEKIKAQVSRRIDL